MLKGVNEEADASIETLKAIPANSVTIYGVLEARWTNRHKLRGEDKLPLGKSPTLLDSDCGKRVLMPFQVPSS